MDSSNSQDHTSSQALQVDPQNSAHNQHPPAAAPQQASPIPGNPNDAFVCQWIGCGERMPNAENLYEHVCDRHIGRKSTNNLNLQCAWGNCHVQVVKRDHITSHIRVHVPLKPHRCDFCGKAFKRPQDLKKHVKTHAEDTVVVGANGGRPNAGGNQPNGHQNGYGNGLQGKPPANYFPDNQMPGGMPMNYGPQGHNGNGSQGFYGHGAPQSAYAYGNVNYANQGPDLGNQATLDSIKSGLEILRRLFPEQQRGEFDPRSYAQVESRIAALQSLNLPFLTQPMMAQPQAVGVGGGADGSFGGNQYSLPPMDNLRTKNDLINLDQLFATMQSTIYDNPTEVAQAGVGQPGAHYVPAGAGYGSNHSAAALQVPSSHNVAAATPSSHHSGTPALTPPSSAVSNTSSNSPPSMHLSNTSPTTSGGMYPTLPGTSTTQGYVPPNMAPTSTLGSQFDQDQRRRYSGGRLQKAAPSSLSRSKPEDAMDTASDGGVTPKNAAHSSSSSDAEQTSKVQPRRPGNFSSLNLDPALGGSTSPTAGEMSEEAVKANEAWVSSIRVIEALRSWVSHRLENHLYQEEGEEEEMDHDQKKSELKEEKDSLYPSLTEAASE